MPVSYQKLFSQMQEKGIKKIDLRTKYKINPKTVDSLVNNRSVTVDTIIQLCEILDCQPGDLMEYIKEQQNKRTEQSSPVLFPFLLFGGGGGYISGKRKFKSHKRGMSGQKTFEMHFSFLRFRSSVSRADELRQFAGRTAQIFLSRFGWWINTSF